MSKKNNSKKVKKDYSSKERNFDLKLLDNKKEVFTSFFLDSNYVPMTKKQIKSFFYVPYEDEELFEKVLNELENEAFIYIDDSKRYRVVNNNKILKCVYHRKNERFGIGISERISDEVYIEKLNSFGAMDGDDVLVAVFKDNNDLNKRVEGAVTKIVKRNTVSIIGRLIKNNNFGFVEPINTKEMDIFISKKDMQNFKNNDIVEVKITKYPTSKLKAEGKVIRKISDFNDTKGYINALYEYHSLNDKLEFSNKIKDELKSIPDEVLEEEKKGRVDRRNFNVFTIDSEDAKDLDDAVSVLKTEDSNYLLSVYIADVSHYVKPKTELNKEAIERGTSIYIPGTVIPMLPKKISNGICSLNENVDRLALAVDMKIDGKTGEVLDYNIFKALIKVKKKMTYEKVYKILTNTTDKDIIEEYGKYKDILKDFFELSKILENKRKKQGLIDFDEDETKVVLDENGEVIDIKPYEITFANKIIEEFMLITNMVVAKHFNLLKLPFIYRIHEKPDEEKLRELNEILSLYGKRIKNLKNIHSKAIADILNEFNGSDIKDIISHFVLRSLKVARYSNECIGHFGLNTKYYTHFTSPIRRYPDLFIHRVISTYIDNNYVLDENVMLVFSKQAEKYAYSSSDAEKNATKIERDFIDLYKAIYMNNFIGKNFDATVCSITSFGMFVRLKNTVEGLIPFEYMGGNDYFEYIDDKKILVGKNTGKIYKIGDSLRVELIKVNVRARQIDFKVI